MFHQVLNTFFGCWHAHYSFPITMKRGNRNHASFATGTYVVCLDCGKELPYDWQTMKIVRTKKDGELAPVRSLATKEASS
ncbi:MAG: hypothetical protein J2P13_01915 [Acidobacteria bacterium]|nr:hypothetical protein [Acidobacteriota bacterium]